MVILFLTALDQQANQREFSCRLPSIEANFDFLNQLVAKKHTLLSAYLIENETRINLPLAAFDGIPVSVGIQALEQEWKNILRQPRSSELTHQQDIIKLTHRRVKQYTNSILIYEQIIDQLSNWTQRAQSKTLLLANNSWLIRYYEDQITSYQSRLDSARFHANLMANRLNQLKESVTL